MYDLVDALTFKPRIISQNMWPVFEMTYNLFKSDAVDYLEGEIQMTVLPTCSHALTKS